MQVSTRRNRKMGWWEPELALEGYGFGIGCDEWRVLNSRLELLLAQAETTPAVVGSSAYLVAKKYNDENSGLSSPVVLFGSSCTVHVNEINSVIANLSSAISSSGAQPVVGGPAIAPTDSALDQIPSLLKWVAGGAIAVSVAIVAGPVIKTLFSRRR